MHRMLDFSRQHEYRIACAVLTVIILLCIRSFWWYNPLHIPFGKYVCLRNISDDEFKNFIIKSNSTTYKFELLSFGRYYDDNLFVGYWYSYRFGLYDPDWVGDEFFEKRPECSPDDMSEKYMVALDFREALPGTSYTPTIRDFHGESDISRFDRFFGELLGGGVCVSKQYLTEFNLLGD